MRRPGPSRSSGPTCPQSIGLIETVAPTLGECLHHASATLLRVGHGAVCLINSDSPTLPVGYLVAAATALGGTRRPHRARPLDRWWILSDRHEAPASAACSRTSPGARTGFFLRRLRAPRPSAFPVFQLPTWYDVDDAGDAAERSIDEVLDGKPFRRRRHSDARDLDTALPVDAGRGRRAAGAHRRRLRRGRLCMTSGCSRRCGGAGPLFGSRPWRWACARSRQQTHALHWRLGGWVLIGSFAVGALAAPSPPPRWPAGRSEARSCSSF